MFYKLWGDINWNLKKFWNTNKIYNDNDIPRKNLRKYEKSDVISQRLGNNFINKVNVQFLKFLFEVVSSELISLSRISGDMSVYSGNNKFALVSRVHDKSTVVFIRIPNFYIYNNIIAILTKKFIVLFSRNLQKN